MGKVIFKSVNNSTEICLELWLWSSEGAESQTRMGWRTLAEAKEKEHEFIEWIINWKMIGALIDVWWLSQPYEAVLGASIKWKVDYDIYSGMMMMMESICSFHKGQQKHIVRPFKSIGCWFVFYGMA